MKGNCLLWWEKFFMQQILKAMLIVSYWVETYSKWQFKMYEIVMKFVSFCRPVTMDVNLPFLGQFTCLGNKKKPKEKHILSVYMITPIYFICNERFCSSKFFSMKNFLKWSYLVKIFTRLLLIFSLTMIFFSDEY